MSQGNRHQRLLKFLFVRKEEEVNTHKALVRLKAGFEKGAAWTGGKGYTKIIREIQEAEEKLKSLDKKIEMLEYLCANDDDDLLESQSASSLDRGESFDKGKSEFYVNSDIENNGKEQRNRRTSNFSGSGTDSDSQNSPIWTSTLTRSISNGNFGDVSGFNRKRPLPQGNQDGQQLSLPSSPKQQNSNLLVNDNSSAPSSPKGHRRGRSLNSYTSAYDLEYQEQRQKIERTSVTKILESEHENNSAANKKQLKNGHVRTLSQDDLSSRKSSFESQNILKQTNADEKKNKTEDTICDWVIIHDKKKLKHSNSMDKKSLVSNELQGLQKNVEKHSITKKDSKNRNSEHNDYKSINANYVDDDSTTGDSAVITTKKKRRMRSKSDVDSKSKFSGIISKIGGKDANTPPRQLEIVLLNRPVDGNEHGNEGLIPEGLTTLPINRAKSFSDANSLRCNSEFGNDSGNSNISNNDNIKIKINNENSSKGNSHNDKNNERESRNENNVCDYDNNNTSTNSSTCNDRENSDNENADNNNIKKINSDISSRASFQIAKRKRKNSQSTEDSRKRKNSNELKLKNSAIRMRHSSDDITFRHERSHSDAKLHDGENHVSSFRRGVSNIKRGVSPVPNMLKRSGSDVSSYFLKPKDKLDKDYKDKHTKDCRPVTSSPVSRMRLFSSSVRRWDKYHRDSQSSYNDTTEDDDIKRYELSDSEDDDDNTIQMYRGKFALKHAKSQGAISVGFGDIYTCDVDNSDDDNDETNINNNNTITNTSIKTNVNSDFNSKTNAENEQGENSEFKISGRADNETYDLQSSNFSIKVENKGNENENEKNYNDQASDNISETAVSDFNNGIETVEVAIINSIGSMDISDDFMDANDGEKGKGNSSNKYEEYMNQRLNSMKRAQSTTALKSSQFSLPSPLESSSSGIIKKKKSNNEKLSNSFSQGNMCGSAFYISSSSNTNFNDKGTIVADKGAKTPPSLKTVSIGLDNEIMVDTGFDSERQMVLKAKLRKLLTEKNELATDSRALDVKSVVQLKLKLGMLEMDIKEVKAALAAEKNSR